MAATTTPNMAPPLPALGSVTADNQSLVWDWLSGLAFEASDGAAEFIAQADFGRAVFIKGKDSEPAYGELIVNEIQNAIITRTYYQTHEPIQPSIEPVETGEPPTYYWNGPEWLAMQLAMGPAQVPPYQLVPTPAADEFGNPTGGTNDPQPLSPDIGEQLSDLINTPIGVSPFGTPIAFKEDWIVAVDDALVAEVYQSVVDVLWARADIDRALRSNVLWTNVDGATFWLYQWDDVAKKPVLYEMSARQVYVDPTKETVDKFAYAMVDWVLDADEAKRLAPELTEFINESAATGNPAMVDRSTQFGQANDRTYRRATVTLRIAWMRNQPIPLTADDAVGGGHVMHGEVPIEQGEGDESNVMSPAGSGYPDVASSAGAGGDIQSSGDLSQIAAAPPTRPAFLLNDGTHEDVTPDDDGTLHPAWPTRPGVRQCVAIARTNAGRIINDGESPFGDLIPIIHNVNIPIPGTPYGQGEPYRLWRLQRANNDTLNSMVECGKNFAAPAQMMSESTFNALGVDNVSKAYINAKHVAVAPDDIFKQTNGEIVKIIPPPPLPPSLVQLQPILKSEIQDSSGHVEVSRGVAPSSDMSGKAIQSLQAGASTSMSFQAMSTSDGVRHLTKLILHCARKYMSIDDLCKIVRKYPRHVIADVMARQEQMDFDVKVTVQGSAAAVLAAKKQEAVQLFNVRDPVTGEPILSMESTRERAGLDNKLERRRWQASLKGMGGMVATAAGGPATGGGGGGAPQPDQGGQPTPPMPPSNNGPS